MPSKSNIPTHVAIIMDGNRRWAKQNKLPILMGHRRATFEIIEPLVDTAIEAGILYLTLWAFSTENWQRDRHEVEGLLQLFRKALTDNIPRLHKKNVRFQTIGDISKFPADIQKQIINGVEKTKRNTAITAIMALNYGGRDEIVRAIERLRSSSKFKIQPFDSAQGKSSKLTEEDFNMYLDTARVPDPDLIIRTGGEKRLSGFLLWQSEYSELYFTDVLFPDFTPSEFKKAIHDYQQRKRRFGR